MNKKFIIKKNEEYQQIIKMRNTRKNKYFVIHSRKNNYNYNRYGISVGKKIGNAVTRNKYKRKIKDILSKNNLNNSIDYVIIVRKEILNINYEEIKLNLLKLIKGERNEKN